MREKTLELADKTDEIYMIRPGTSDSERHSYPGNVHVWEWVKHL